MKWIAFSSVAVGAVAWVYLTYREKSSAFVTELVEWLKGWAYKIPFKK
jgi:hypothetical protein